MNKVMSFCSSITLTGVPLLAVVILCAASFYAGNSLTTVKPTGKYLTAEKNAVIFQAVFDRNGESPENLKLHITDPILAILKKYADLGYVIIDTAKDERGAMSVIALPPDTKDITAELLAATKITKSP